MWVLKRKATENSRYASKRFTQLAGLASATNHKEDENVEDKHGIPGRDWTFECYH